MNFGEFLHQSKDEIRQTIRNFGKIDIKITNNKYAASFNKICIDENLLPTYTNIYITEF